MISGYIVVHEMIHGVIMYYYDCRDVGYGFDSMGFYTVCNDINRVESEIELLAHSINEIVGYSFGYFLAIFLGMNMFKDYRRAENEY